MNKITIIGLLSLIFLSTTAVITFFPLPGSGILQMDSSSDFFREGEDLLYEVRWWKFNLGQIRLRSLEARERRDETIYTAAAFIDSYRGIPFVNLHVIAYSEMDSNFYSRASHTIENYNDSWWGINYDYRPEINGVVMKESWHETLESPPYKESESDTLYLDSPAYHDGLSILYFARKNAKENRAIAAPTLAYGKIGNTIFRFYNKITEVKIDLFDKPVRVVELDGRAEFRGIFGLKGDFIGWFSDDEAAVPIRGEISVILGSVVVELIDYKRNGWLPPIE